MAAHVVALAEPSARQTHSRPAIAAPPDPEFDQFFLANFDPLVRSLTAIAGDREVATDCVQEAFVRAYARWPRIRRYRKPTTWVRKVAINLSRDAARADARRRDRERRSDDAWRAVAPAADAPAPGLEDLLGDLTPRQRAVATLFYVDDLPIADIARSLSLSQGAVKFHLNGARERLRSVLDPQGAADE